MDALDSVHGTVRGRVSTMRTEIPLKDPTIEDYEKLVFVVDR